MKDRNEKRYCTLDHANKRRELADQTPYQFWVRQVQRESGKPPGAPPRPAARCRKS